MQTRFLALVATAVLAVATLVGAHGASAATVTSLSCTPTSQNTSAGVPVNLSCSAVSTGSTGVLDLSGSAPGASSITITSVTDSHGSAVPFSTGPTTGSVLYTSVAPGATLTVTAKITYATDGTYVITLTDQGQTTYAYVLVGAPPQFFYNSGVGNPVPSQSPAYSGSEFSNSGQKPYQP